MRKLGIILVVFFIVATPSWWFIVEGVEYAVHGWITSPITMISKIIFSFAFGQAIFWIFGYDQFGLFMKPIKQLGLGQKVAFYVSTKIPFSKTTSWFLKFLEILSDMTKIPVEGLLFIKTGFTPDALATAITQPLWSTLEVTEKVSGALISPQRVHSLEQVRLSIGCIYGSLFRLLLAAFLWYFGMKLYIFIGLPT